jgi:hypothetical protein
MYRRSRASQIVNAMQRAWDFERLDYVLFNELETGVIEQRANVFDTAGQKVINAKYPVPALNQPIA